MTGWGYGARSSRGHHQRDSRERRRDGSLRRRVARSRSRGGRRPERRSRSVTRSRGRRRNRSKDSRDVVRRSAGDARKVPGYHRSHRENGTAQRQGSGYRGRHKGKRSPSSVSSCSSAISVVDSRGTDDDEDQEDDEESEYYDYESESSAPEDGDAALAKRLKKQKDDKEKQAKKDDIVHFEWKAGMWLNARYKVSKLLGDGTFGRVLLVDDRKKHKLAIKVIRNVDKYIKSAKREAEILQDIREADPKKSTGCVKMFDTFWHQTPDGEAFFCLAFEVLGASLYDMLKQNRFRGMWVQDIQSIAMQSLEVLRFLHSDMKLTHTDLKLENVLFQTLEPHVPAEFSRMEQYLAAHPSQTGRQLAQYMRPASTKIKLIDFGNATYELEHHSSIINTRQYRAPEVILAMGWDEVSDLWSVGCIVMELYTGELLFRTHESFEHLALMEKVLQDFPSEMLAKASAERQQQFLTQVASRWQLDWPQRASTAVSSDRVRSQRALHDLVLEHHRPVADFVASLLTLDPKRRPSAEAALAHPFLYERVND